MFTVDVERAYEGASERIPQLDRDVGATRSQPPTAW